jgi:hypothetical protein
MPPDIPKHWDAFLKDLDRSLEYAVELHCLGGFVLIMLAVPRFNRSTASTSNS